MFVMLCVVSVYAGTIGCLSGEERGERICINEYGKFVADIYNPEEDILVRVEGMVVNYDGSSLDIEPGDSNVRVIFKLNKPLDGHREIPGVIAWSTSGHKLVNFGGIEFEN